MTTLDVVALGLAGLGTGVTTTLFAIHRLRHRGDAVSPQTTRSGSGRPAKCASRLSTASIPIAVRVSSVALPMCGRSVTFGAASSAGGTVGSSA